MMDKDRIKRLVRELIAEIGEDPYREGLIDTPNRIADMYEEIFKGYEAESELSVKFSEDSDVVVADRKSTRLNSSHIQKSRMPSSA